MKNAIIELVKKAIGENSYLDEEKEFIVMDCNDIDHVAEWVADVVVEMFGCREENI